MDYCSLSLTSLVLDDGSTIPLEALDLRYHGGRTAGQSSRTIESEQEVSNNTSNEPEVRKVAQAPLDINSDALNTLREDDMEDLYWIEDDRELDLQLDPTENSQSSQIFRWRRNCYVENGTADNVLSPGHVVSDRSLFETQGDADNLEGCSGRLAVEAVTEQAHMDDEICEGEIDLVLWSDRSLSSSPVAHRTKSRRRASSKSTPRTSSQPSRSHSQSSGATKTHTHRRYRSVACDGCRAGRKACTDLSGARFTSIESACDVETCGRCDSLSIPCTRSVSGWRRKGMTDSASNRRPGSFT